ncbi:MAG: hypothetical protein JRI80_02075 [Deltaproteobacteria bacterium]|nr:hypothetical protein [Deltaproteobacteria bacterium]
MKSLTPVSLLIVISLLVLFLQSPQTRTGLKYPDRCMTCHHAFNDPGKSHALESLGCASCHLGNPYSLDEKRAHVGMIKNPGDLRVVDKTCGKPACHPQIASRVKRSIMATNRGILRSIQMHWVPFQATRTSVPELLGPAAPTNPALDHYRKMCGGCHLWKKRGDHAEEIGLRGGGCSDCHIPDTDFSGKTPGKEQVHPAITIHIPIANCVKCHNRSARIGLSYRGHYESAGYGTPYEGAGLSKRRLSGRRFFLQVDADVHFGKAGMSCIDCHTSTGLMGDGNEYDQMGKQVDITCSACHDQIFRDDRGTQSLASILFNANDRVPHARGRRIGFTRKGTPLYNLQLVGGHPILFRKKDGKPLELQSDSGKRAYHTLPGHERLSCQSCHSSWMPQCYGCHLAYNKQELQKDWLTGTLRKGRWKEARSSMRFLKPALGVRHSSKIFPLSPCQVFLPDAVTQQKIFTVSAFDPHTTLLQSRSCVDCHGDPKTLGLGEGILWMKNGTWTFRPTYDAAASPLGISFPLDGVIQQAEKQSENTIAETARPFNRSEVDRILSVNGCLGCHKRYDDPIFRDFSTSLKVFKAKEDLPCKR